MLLPAGLEPLLNALRLYPESFRCEDLRHLFYMDAARSQSDFVIAPGMWKVLPTLTIFPDRRNIVVHGPSRRGSDGTTGHPWLRPRSQRCSGARARHWISCLSAGVVRVASAPCHGSTGTWCDRFLKPPVQSRDSGESRIPGHGLMGGLVDKRSPRVFAAVRRP